MPMSGSRRIVGSAPYGEAMTTLPPRWQPQDEAALDAALQDGVLDENHYRDVKRSIGDTPSARKETARDLASFAINGGVLIVGVHEDKAAQTFSLAPQPLAGLPERIEQVAATAIDPPLFVACRSIASSSEAGTGYVIVDVPPSPSAPHMVEGVYFGRGDKTKIRLSDADVLRYHGLREAEESIGYRLLDAEVARDPVERANQQRGRLYLVAHPLRARREVARDFVRATGQYGAADLWSLVDGAEAHIASDVRDFAPQPSMAGHTVRRAEGTARVSEASSGPGRTYKVASSWTDETDLLDIEFREDGGIRVLMGRMTDTWRQGQDGGVQVIADGLAVAYALRVVIWARDLGERVGYRGPWTFGVHAHGLRGLLSSVSIDDWRRYDSDTQAYDADEYRQVTTAQHEEMLSAAGHIAYRLVGRLIRGLGSDRKYSVSLTSPPVDA